VVLFFVHTSFVLMASLERLSASAESDGSLAVAFWIRRFFRIYPLAMLFVVLTPIFHIPADPGETYAWIGVKGFVANLALAQNLTYSPNILGPLWSLPLEVQMYVLLPFAYFAVRGAGRFRSLGLWALAVVLALTLPRISERLDVFRYAPCFTSGIVAYDMIRSRWWSWRLPAWVWPVGIAAAVMLFGPHDNVSIGDKIGRAWGVSLMVGVLYANVAEGSPNRLHSVFHWIAEHSYGIYLSHIVLLWMVLYPMSPFPLWARIAVLVGGAVAVPALLYVSIEKPLILVGSHVARRLLHRGVVKERQAA
jgi:peptidoglycan/LPS O-acetylase OafA/YrhL